MFAKNSPIRSIYHTLQSHKDRTIAYHIYLGRLVGWLFVTGYSREWTMFTTPSESYLFSKIDSSSIEPSVSLTINPDDL